MSISQDDFALFQLPQLQLDGDVLRDAEVHGPGAGGVGELNVAVNQAHLIKLKGALQGMTAGKGRKRYRMLQTQPHRSKHPVVRAFSLSLHRNF